MAVTASAPGKPQEGEERRREKEREKGRERERQRRATNLLDDHATDDGATHTNGCSRRPCLGRRRGSLGLILRGAGQSLDHVTPHRMACLEQKQAEEALEIVLS